MRQAFLFAAGIVALFSAIGIFATFIAGPFGVVQLASNPWVNGLIAMVFFALGLSLLGAFELTPPSSLLTRLDGVSQRGGVLGGLILLRGKSSARVMGRQTWRDRIVYTDR